MRICAFGDSITQGNNLDFAVDAWPHLVARRLGVTVDDLGVGGSLLHNSGPASPPRLMIPDAVNAAIASWSCRPPAAAVVLAGHNDVIEHTVDYAQPLAPTSLEQSKWAAIAVDSALRAAGVPLVLWVTLCPRTTGTLTQDHPDWPPIIQGRVVNFNAWLVAQFADRVVDTRGRFGDTGGGLGDPSFYLGDGLHPNPNGHRVIADRVAAALATRLHIDPAQMAAL